MKQVRTRKRWECSQDHRPTLLGHYTTDGYCEIKIGDRFYLASGVIHATCPTCGNQHILDLADTGRLLATA